MDHIKSALPNGSTTDRSTSVLRWTSDAKEVPDFKGRTNAMIVKFGIEKKFKLPGFSPRRGGGFFMKTPTHP